MNPPVYTTGSWRPHPGHGERFLDAWTEFANWSAGMPGVHMAVLARDLRDPERFVSVVGWDSIEAVRAWKSSPQFKPRMARVQEHIDRFAPTELEVVATVAPGVAAQPAGDSDQRSKARLKAPSRAA
jgi:heme-degrading monooxygenase HmoA